MCNAQCAKKEGLAGPLRVPQHRGSLKRVTYTLYLRKDIERWGSGIKRIHDACREENVDVEFKKLESGFLVVLHRKDELGERLGETVEKTTQKLPKNYP